MDVRSLIMSLWLVVLLGCVIATAAKYNVDSAKVPDQDIMARIEELEIYIKQQQDTVKRVDELEKQHSDEMQSLRHENAAMNFEIKQLKQRDVEMTDRMAELERATHELINCQDLPSTTDDLRDKRSETLTGDVDDVKSRSLGKTAGAARPPPKGHNSIRQTTQEMQVAFFATVSSHINHLGQNQPLVFDHVITNVGHAYHNSTGAFTAPIAGVYVFSTTLFGHQDSKHFDFTVNGQAVSHMYLSAPTGDYETASQTVILNLNQGDDVTVNNIDLDKMAFGYHYCTYSGFLLYVNEAGNAIIG